MCIIRSIKLQTTYTIRGVIYTISRIIQVRIKRDLLYILIHEKILDSVRKSAIVFNGMTFFFKRGFTTIFHSLTRRPFNMIRRYLMTLFKFTKSSRIVLAFIFYILKYLKYFNFKRIKCLYINFS